MELDEALPPQAELSPEAVAEPEQQWYAPLSRARARFALTSALLAGATGYFALTTITRPDASRLAQLQQVLATADATADASDPPIPHISLAPLGEPSAAPVLVMPAEATTLALYLEIPDGVGAVYEAAASDARGNLVLSATALAMRRQGAKTFVALPLSADLVVASAPLTIWLQPVGKVSTPLRYELRTAAPIVPLP